MAGPVILLQLGFWETPKVHDIEDMDRGRSWNQRRSNEVASGPPHDARVKAFCRNMGKYSCFFSPPAISLNISPKII